jgi:hypothetical protein
MDFLIETKMKDADRDDWINDVRGLYNFAPHFAAISTAPPYVRFNLNATSGGMMFAIITCLRYLNEYPEDILLIRKLQKHLKMEFKEAFVTHHFMSTYESCHKLLTPRGDFNASMAVQGVIEPHEPSWCLQKHIHSFTYINLFQTFSGGTGQPYNLATKPPIKIKEMYERLKAAQLLQHFKEYNLEQKVAPSSYRW